MDLLKEIVDTLDEYDATIGSAPENTRADLRRLYPLPGDMEMIREDVDDMGTYEVQDYLQEIYDEWSEGNDVPDYFSVMLDDPDHRNDMIGRVIDAIESINRTIRELETTLQPRFEPNIFINTPFPSPGEENLPPN